MAQFLALWRDEQRAPAEGRSEASERELERAGGNVADAPSPGFDQSQRDLSRFCLDCVRGLVAEAASQIHSDDPEDLMALGQQLQVYSTSLVCINTNHYRA